MDGKRPSTVPAHIARRSHKEDSFTARTQRQVESFQSHPACGDMRGCVVFMLALNLNLKCRLAMLTVLLTPVCAENLFYSKEFNYFRNFADISELPKEHQLYY